MPKDEEKVFKCVYCNTVTQHEWNFNKIEEGKIDSCNVIPNFVKMSSNSTIINPSDKTLRLNIAKCILCNNISIWYNQKMIYPLKSLIEVSNEDMPEKIKELYNEARDVYPISKKSSTALLRLVLQYLCKELGESGKNINTDIGNLVKKGLPSEVQMALDSLRITVNQSVHLGELNIDEDEELVESLFFLLNFVTEKMITDKRKVEEFYKKMPKELREAVKKRDNKNE